MKKFQVLGELSNNHQPMRRFMQTFVLAPQTPKKVRNSKQIQKNLQKIREIKVVKIFSNKTKSASKRISWINHVFPNWFCSIMFNFVPSFSILYNFFQCRSLLHCSISLNLFKSRLIDFLINIFFFHIDFVPFYFNLFHIIPFYSSSTFITTSSGIKMKFLTILRTTLPVATTTTLPLSKGAKR